MAVHPDGKAFVVTNWGTCMLSVYALPTGECVRSLNGGTIDGTDGCAKFYTPCKVCFAPNGHLLVSEDSNKRVQELTFEGQFVRFIGNEVIDDDVVGLAADSKHIAVGKFGPGHQVFLFDFYTGSLIRSFGSSEVGQGVYRMSMCHGIRFTADGQHVIVASYATNSVLTFTLAGEVVSMFEVNEPRDVQVAPNGDVVVTGRAEVHVFNRDGSPLRSFGCTGSEPGQFKLDSVYALAWWGAHLFVLDNKNGRVQVFE